MQVSGALWQGLERLPEGPEQIRAAAIHFEALLVQHLLKTMREATRTDTDQEGGAGAETYLEMAEQQMALALAERGGFGIARMLLKQLERPADKTHEGPAL